MVVTDNKQRYMDARVEGAKTLAEAYDWYAEYPAVFVAGVQYALDKMLSQADQFGVSLSVATGQVISVEMLNGLATEILERAKRGEPQ